MTDQQHPSQSSCVVIPARFASTRFPGKPLAMLHGKPMILWVAELSAEAVGREHVYVATEDERIAAVVRDAGFAALMTSTTAATGTDRIAEAAGQIDYDIYLNVQGDEPMIWPEDIRRCRDAKAENPGVIINGFTWIGEEEDPESRNIPKVVATEGGRMVYMSRKALPGSKDPAKGPDRFMKQVCIYGFTAAELAAYAAFGRKSYLESYEDIEILRFLELDRQIMLVETKPGSLAVDDPADVAIVEEAMKQRYGL